MSFQSLLESTECGAANPMVDLARQFTGTNTGAATNSVPLDELNPGNLTEKTQDEDHFASAVESLLLNEEAQSSTFFNMESLLNEVNQLENQSNFETANPKEPLISNHPPSVEQNFWKNEATADSELSGLESYSKLPELNVDWTDEYLKKLEMNNNIDDVSKMKQQQEENVWDLNQESLNSYRNQPVENPQSFFSNFITPGFGMGESSSQAEINDANLKDLVSDQESRLIDMLLGNNLPTEVQQSQADGEKETKNEELQAQTTSNVEDAKEQEFFFHENQFDDLEFWSKLAEEWNSSESAPLSDTHVGENGRQVHIIESLDELVQESHPDYYQHVENNPFITKPAENEQEESSSAEKEAPIDYLEEGLKRMKSGDLAAAVLLFEAATQNDPNSVTAWKLLGIVNAKNENDVKAIQALKRCLALDSSNLEALMSLAMSYTNESMVTQACYALREWLTRHPEYKGLVRDTAGEEHDSGKYRGPTSLAHRWIEKKTVFSDGFFDSVKDSFLAAAAQASTDPDVQCGLGALYNLSGEYAKATEHFRAALEHRPDDYCLWNRFGASLANGGNAEESMFAYREALVRYPGYIRARYNLAVSCIMLGTLEEAAEHLLTVLNLQTAGADSIKGKLSLDRDNITSSNVWNLMRSVMSMLGRNDLLGAVDGHNLELLNKEFNYKKPEPDTSG